MGQCLSARWYEKIRITMRIQLLSCKVTNFRSIRDTGFFNFSADNITAIIGQNESGKTSILEALEAFSTGELDPDVLRSELEFPEVTCVFRVSEPWFQETFEDVELPRGLKTKIKDNKNKISLTRKWSSPTESEITINHLELDTLFTPPEQKNSPILETEPTVPAETAPAVVAPTPSPEPEEEPFTADDFIERVTDSLPEFQRFEDFESLLPDTMDLSDILKKNDKIEGLKGVLNLLSIMGLDVAQLEKLTEQFRNNNLRDKNRSFTAEFKQFWSQKIGNRDKVEVQVEFERHGAEKPEIAGTSYLSFWIVENTKQLRPKQRSKGLRWFLSFYLQLKASSTRGDNKKDLILLIDEPAGSLHAKAQEDVLKVFETLKKNIQVIYTTHTHHLLDLTKLYRIIAAQRETVDNDDYSLADTHIFSAHQLGAASTDTLTPIFDCMGTSFANQNVIGKTNNILVEEVSVSYYLKALLKLKGMSDVHLLPANGTPNVPQLARLLLGWGIKFGVLVDDENSGKAALKKVRDELFPGSEGDARLDAIFRVIPDCHGVEDVFSKEDFAKHIAKVEVTEITKPNSEYVKSAKNKQSKGFLAVKFYNDVESGELTLQKLDKTSRERLDKLAAIVKEIMDEISPPVQTVAPEGSEPVG